MFSIYLLKSRFQSLLNPIANALIRAKVTPNQITWGSLLMSIIFGIFFCFYSQFIAWIGAIFFIRMGLNALDGMIARKTKSSSAFGHYLNEIGDIISDTILYIPFVFIDVHYQYFVFAIIFLSILSETAGILGAIIGKTRRYDGPMGKSDRAFFFSFIGLMTLFFNQHHFLPFCYGFLISSLLLSIYNRVRAGLKEV